MDVICRAQGAPSKSNQTNRFQGSKPKQHFETTLWQEAVGALSSADLVVTHEAWQVHDVGKEVCEVDGDEGPSLSQDTKAPLAVYLWEGLQEREDKCIGETREQRQAESDWLTEKRLEWTNPNFTGFLERDTR